MVDGLNYRQLRPCCRDRLHCWLTQCKLVVSFIWIWKGAFKDRIRWKMPRLQVRMHLVTDPVRGLKVHAMAKQTEYCERALLKPVDETRLQGTTAFVEVILSLIPARYHTMPDRGNSSSTLALVDFLTKSPEDFGLSSPTSTASASPIVGTSAASSCPVSLAPSTSSAEPLLAAARPSEPWEQDVSRFHVSGDRAWETRAECIWLSLVSRQINSSPVWHL